MATTLGTRFSATLLLLLFLAGNLGVSGVDAFLFHQDASDKAPLVHIEAADSDCHAAVCVVAFAINAGRALSAPDHGGILPPPLQNTGIPAQQRHTAGRVGLIASLPRAPPLTH